MFALFDQLFELFWLGRAGLLAEMGVRQQQPSNKLPGAPSSDRARRGRSIAAAGRRCAVRRRERPRHHPDLQRQRTAAPEGLWRVQRRRDGSGAGRDAKPAVAHGQASDPAAGAHQQASCQPRPARAIQRSIRRGGEIVELPRRRRKHKPRPLVVICDVSGSMARTHACFCT
ncbi:MAG: VWA domain-containing protein [Anaerolineales bacterium]|nr:VWA domain-containing protein [Anaerolineales bacterium]